MRCGLENVHQRYTAQLALHHPFLNKRDCTLLDLQPVFPQEIITTNNERLRAVMKHLAFIAVSRGSIKISSINRQPHKRPSRKENFSLSSLYERKLLIQNNPLRDTACASLRSPASSFTAFSQNDQTPNGQGRNEPPAKQVHKKDREQYAQNQIGNERDHLSINM